MSVPTPHCFSTDIETDDDQILTSAEAMAYFDQLDPVDVNFMLGCWKGAGWPTHHPMDGMLEAVNWHGKEFIDSEHVHPLVFLDAKQRPFWVNPFWMPISLSLKLSLPKISWMNGLFLSLKPLIQTHSTTARLRMIEYRGKVSATMIYDQKPILDVFRKLDDDTVLGLMDMKGMDQPFFFKLTRERR